MSRQTEVIDFINRFIDGRDAIQERFSNGYCYYFAKMLEEAFGGEVVWPKYYSHIVWHDTKDNICYDVIGEYRNWSEEDLIPIQYLTERNLDGFKHVKPSAALTTEEIAEQMNRVNEYEVSKGYPITRYINNEVVEYPIKSFQRSGVYRFDVKTATLIATSTSAVQQFISDNKIGALPLD